MLWLLGNALYSTFRPGLEWTQERSLKRSQERPQGKKESDGKKDENSVKVSANPKRMAKGVARGFLK